MKEKIVKNGIQLSRGRTLNMNKQKPEDEKAVD